MCRRLFTLRTFMAVILAWGLLFAWVRSMGSFLYALVVVSHSFVAWVLCFITAFIAASRYGPVVCGPRGRSTVTGLLALSLVGLLYLGWGHHRAMYDFVSGLDRRFPYPDPAVNALERWFDARRPVSTPGSIKLHGEYPLVGFVLGMLVLSVMSLAGFLLGVVSNRPVSARPRLDETPEPSARVDDRPS